jgi:hypothetical protein
MKCWNCEGSGLIPFEDDPFTIGDYCPICSNKNGYFGEISLWKWIKHIIKVKK